MSVTRLLVVRHRAFPRLNSKLRKFYKRRPSCGTPKKIDWRDLMGMLKDAMAQLLAVTCEDAIPGSGSKAVSRCEVYLGDLEKFVRSSSDPSPLWVLPVVAVEDAGATPSIAVPKKREGVLAVFAESLAISRDLSMARTKTGVYSLKQVSCAPVAVTVEGVSLPGLRLMNLGRDKSVALGLGTGLFTVRDAPIQLLTIVRDEVLAHIASSR